MRIEHLNYLICLAETRSIKKAAPRLHTSHQNISKILHQMEDELGAELFIRSAKGLELTKAGQIMLAAAHRIVAEFVDAQQRINQLQTEKILRGELHAYGTPVTNTALLRPLSAAFQKQYPQIAFRFHEYDPHYTLKQLVLHPQSVAFIQLFNNRNFQFVYEPYLDEVITYPLFKDRYLCIASTHSSVSKQKSISLKKFIQHPLVMLKPQPQDEDDILLRLFASFGAYNISCSTNNFLLYTQALANGQGIGISTKIIHGENVASLPSSSLATIEFREDLNFTVCLAIAQNASLTPAGEAFVNFTKQYYALS